MRFGAALAFLAWALAAGAADDGRRWYLQIDNDVVFGTDRWYSSGVRLAAVMGAFELGLVQEIYTPDAKHWEPGKDDRIPAARLLLSGARHESGVSCFETIEVALGVRGPAALGRQSAEEIHRLIPAPAVDWSRQLENRFDARVAFTHSERLAPRGLQAHFGAVAGNQVSFAHAGLEMRTGARASMASQLLRFAPTPPWSPDGWGDMGWSAYAGASVRAVVHNELLSRNYDPAGGALDRRRAVGRAVAGVAWSQPWGAVTFEIAADTREFAEQAHPHAFGALAIHVAF